MSDLENIAGAALCWCGRPARHQGWHKGVKRPKRDGAGFSSQGARAAAKPAHAPALPGRGTRLRALAEREVAACHAAIARLKDEIRARQAQLLDIEAALSSLAALLDTYRVLALPAPDRVAPAAAPLKRDGAPAAKPFALAMARPRASEVGADGTVEEDFAPEEVDFDQVKRWATVRNLSFASWDDLPAINAHREKFELPPFKRGLARRRQA